MAVIETERLELRPLRFDDLAGLHRLYADPKLMRYVTGRPRTLEETAEKLRLCVAAYEEHGIGFYAARFRAGEEIIGRCGLDPRVTGRGLEGELAWMIRQDHQGRGLATEAGRALIEHGQALRLRRVYARAMPGNRESIAVMRKLGMVFVEARENEVEYEAVPPQSPR